MRRYKDFVNNTIKESTLSRIYQHTLEREVGIVTAFRARYSKSENISRNRQLAGMIRDAGFGFIKLEGHWVEGHGTEQAKDTFEESLLVIGDQHSGGLRGFLRKCGAEFNQDAILFKPFDSENAVLIGTSGEDEDGNEVKFPGLGKEVVAGRWHPSKIGEFYSKLRNGRTFVFEGTKNVPNVFGRWAKRLSRRA